MSITVNSKEFTVFGNKAAVIADIAFDSSYPYGGESLSLDQNFGLHSVDFCMIEGKAGYTINYDRTNDKLKVFAPAPPIVYEEELTLDSSYQATTKYPAAFFINVGGTMENIAFRSTGIAKASLTAGQCCLASAMAAGERTTLTVSPLNQVTDAYSAIGAGTGWTAGTDWSFSGNKAVKAAGAGSGTLSLDETFPIAGHTYRIVYTVSSRTAGGVTPSIGGTNGTAVSANGTYTEDIVATASAGKLTFTPASDASALSLDDIYVYDLTVFVTYVTQAWKDVWDNLVQDEVVTLSSSAAVSLDNQVLAAMYIDQTTATATALVFGDEDESAADSGKVSICFNQTADAILTSHADQDAKDCKITYIKNPGSGFLADRAFDNETSSKSGSDPYANTFDYPVLLWGYCGQMPVVDGTTQTLLPYFGASVAGNVVPDWYSVGARGSGTAAPQAGFVISGKSNVTGTGAGVWGRIEEIPNIQPLEVSNGQDLSALSSVRMILIGT